MTISVLLADDSGIMRKAIADLLHDDPEIHVCAETASFNETILRASTLHPHVILLDVYMGHEDDVTPSQIKSSLADSKVLAISFSCEGESKTLADSYGAVLLLDKTKLVQDLIPAIKRCVNDPRNSLL